MDLTEDQAQRYRYNILLPEVGEGGQKKILEARVFIVGVGGLGSSVGYYLAAAGVGTIGIIDDDIVELSNLQRQVAHSTKTLGTYKVDSAMAAFKALNPGVEVISIKERVSKDNIMYLIKDYDIVVDCSDNFPTRYLVNDACVILKVPLVSGAVLRFEGQVTTILPKDGHCYRCLFEEMPSLGVVPTSQEKGVLGAITGVVGSLQATEVLKLILEKGDVLKNTFLIYDALKANFRHAKVKRNPRCLACGENPVVTRLHRLN
ncbi:molybdopterin-synthase adenylyltransferase MoeB [Thermodesulfovibrionales bacterium]|nr:molybdopterin-synthase adenylyltransferase MoeB [Thermodesulfovibrionales bacterium]